MGIEKIIAYIATVVDDRVVLLRDREVIRWIFDDLSFLPPIKKRNKTADAKEYKKLEDTWGNHILKTRRPDLFKALTGEQKKQWTNKFGEHICEEMCYLQGKTVYAKHNPILKLHNHALDIETDDEIIEVKTQTYYTSGTAGEKILGVPFKYADVPALVGKPLKIICLGGAEKVSKEMYGNLMGDKCTAQRQKILNYFKELRIEFISATDILTGLINL